MRSALSVAFILLVACSAVADTGFERQTYTYKTVGKLQIQADVYRPPDSEIRPAVVWIHGGALIVGSRNGVPKQLVDLCRSNGFILVSIDYRLAPEVKLPEIVADVRDALEWLRRDGPALFQVDPDRLVVAGGSAGGYLTLMTGTLEPRPTALVAYWGYGDVDGPWYSEPSEFYRTQVPIVSKTDAYRAVGGSPIAFSDGDRSKERIRFYHYLRQNGLWPNEVAGFDPKTDRSKFDPYCPIRNVTASYPPTLLVHGTTDTDVPYEQSKAMAAELARHKVPHELVTVEGAGHGLSGGDRSQVAAAHDRVASFIRKHLLSKASAAEGKKQPDHLAPAPVPPREAAARMTVPHGFQVELLAAEPEVRQPIACTLDERGRLWVVECYAYPDWIEPGQPGRDRVLIFEDADGDGRFDRRTVFWDKGLNLTGIAVGFGGVWLCGPPYVSFIPDRDRDDVPDAKPTVLLDGWSLECRHNTASSLTWGPDGWLYGCNGILETSYVGKPGTPNDQRIAINCGVWRYHPTEHTFEVVANGTTNPWGLDFDDFGEMFITNCVIPHLFHVIPGAHFERMYGQDFNPHLYGLMESCADHIHWAGGDWTSSRGGAGKHSEAGGGHAHAGAMIYLGDKWPDEYRSSVLMCNIHGNRVNRDRLRRDRSGYVAEHADDFLNAHDTWFRGISLTYGPDGGVYLIDWSDTGECHENDSHGAHHNSGRIYKITYGQSGSRPKDLAKSSSAELAQLQLHKNDYFVRHARRLLQERAAAGDDMAAVHQSLWEIFQTNQDVTRKLRALWALFVTNGLTDDRLLAALEHANENVRAWGVRLSSERAVPMLTRPLASDAQSPAPIAKLAAIAATDSSPLVRLHLASGLRRLPTRERWAVAEALVSHSGDAADPNLPLMIWYGIEPLVPGDADRSVALADRSQIPLLREFLARRIVAADFASALAGTTAARPGLDKLVRLLGHTSDASAQLPLLSGIQQGLRGQEQILVPDGWPEVYTKLRASSRAVREHAAAVALAFGDPQAVSFLRRMMLDANADADERQYAARLLAERRVEGLARDLIGLIETPSLRGAAIKALAAYDDPAIPAAVLKHYSLLDEPERADAVITLTARPAYALALLDAIERGLVPRRDLSAFTARQLHQLGRADLNAKLEKVWGAVRMSSADRRSAISQLRDELTPERLREADVVNGRTLYNRTCAQCHKLFDKGGDVGPDLTGSNRTNVEYILENVLDPSAVVGREFKLVTVATTDGRIVAGIIRERTDAAIVMQTPNERVVIAKDQIEEMKESPLSMMPEGVLEKLTRDEIRDLMGYLGSAEQVPLPTDSD